MLESLLVNYSKYFILFLIYSFMGWVIETTYGFLNHKKFVNRGFLIGPLCPIYGFGALLIIVFLGRYIDRPVGLFSMSIIICSLLEYLTSYILEKAFKLRWWDYSDIKYNVEGRICLSYSLVFGIFGTALMYYINPFFINLIESININIIYTVSIILFIILMIDVFLSVNVISKVELKITEESNKDNTEDVVKEVLEYLKSKTFLTRRFASSFPNPKFVKKNKKGYK